MSKTTRNAPSNNPRNLTHYEIDRMLGERVQRATTSDVVRYWRLLDRALGLALRDPERACYFAGEARALAVRCGRPDLAWNASEVASIVGES